MANEMNQQERQPTAGQQGQQNEFAQQGQQSQAEREGNGQQPFVSPDGLEQPRGAGSAAEGQPLGGDDSGTGTGTTLTQGYEGSNVDTLTQSGTSAGSLNQNAGGGSNFSDTDRQGSGFIGAQGTGSDDYLQEPKP